MSTESKGVQIILPARSENVAVVRHAMAGMAESLGMSEEGVADLKTVVTEACMNVVLHAYPDGDGPMAITAQRAGSLLEVEVVDHGLGIKPNAGGDRDSLRLGISLIAALSESFELAGGQDGTRVTMRLPIAAAVANGHDGRPATPEGTEMRVWDVTMLGPTLARIISVLAARSSMSVDRLSDAVLLADAITSRPDELSLGDSVVVNLWDGDGFVHMKVGPLGGGMASRLRDGLKLPDEIGGSLESLADEVSVETDGEGEFLLARFEP